MNLSHLGTRFQSLIYLQKQARQARHEARDGGAEVAKLPATASARSCNLMQDAK